MVDVNVQNVATKKVEANQAAGLSCQGETKMIIYDCEIKKAIQAKNKFQDPFLEYCQGWSDFVGMGISVICAYDCSTKTYRVFMDDNLADFQTMIDESNIVVGWNNHRFDDPLIEAHGITLQPEKSWDLKSALMRSAGLDPNNGHDHHGISLGSTVQHSTALGNKSGHGSDAPGLYQSGKIGALTDYCLNDVRFTKELIWRVQVLGTLVIPGHSPVHVKLPEVMG